MPAGCKNDGDLSRGEETTFSFFGCVIWRGMGPTLAAKRGYREIVFGSRLADLSSGLGQLVRE